jgi:predicted Ser/Thr protein kinase
MNTYSNSPEPTQTSPVPSSDRSAAGASGGTPTLPCLTGTGGEGKGEHPLALPRIAGAMAFGKYAILGEVQAGGMGVVYKARDTELNRVVALKVIKTGQWATDEETARFRREAQAAARLDHPHIIPVYEIGQDNGSLYFTMAFAWGGSLTQQRERFAADLRAALTLVEKVARAVHAAHQRGILHRDLKPGNILLDERGEPWVSDFGLAKFLDASLELTRVGQVLGTPSYMAPEQAAGQTDRITTATDVWALGVILYELLTGQRPFKGISHEDQLRKVRTAEPLPPRTVNRALDRSLETVILRCLEKEPGQRYASAEALADDLARWLRGEPVLARPPSWPARAGRMLRRYRTPVLRLVFAAVLLVLLMLALKGMRPSGAPMEAEDPKQRQALEEKSAQLRRGERVTLLGESGPPGWWRWQPHRTDARTMLDMNQVFRIFAGKEPGMLELLPAAPKRFRLRAQVLHSEGEPQRVVGIYFAHGKRPAEDGATHCFFRVAFNDRVPLVKKPDQEFPTENEVRLTLPIYREKKGDGFFCQLKTTCAISRLFTPAGKIEPMPWRTLEVEVTPEWIKAFWEGELIKSTWGGKEADGVDPKRALELACLALPREMMRPKNPSPEAFVHDEELGLGEGLGLYVEQGIAAFRSVVIEPLPSR